MRTAASLWILVACAATAGTADAQIVRQDLYGTNGTVWASAVSGNTLYIGGDFTEVGPATGSGVPIDASSGLPVTGFPKVTGKVNAVVADGSGGWFIGGLFTHVGGLPRSNLAHIMADNTVAAWSPSANLEVWALARGGSTVYAGGFSPTSAGSRDSASRR